MNKISIVGYIVGIVVSLSSWIRWFFIYPDTSTGLMYVGLGIGLCFVSYAFNWMKNTDHNIENLNKADYSLIKLYGKEEFK